MGWCAVATAQTFYKWMDERGVVHFSDLPPATTKDVEERRLPVAPAAEAKSADTGAQASGAGVAAAPSATPGEGVSGPSRVILVSRKSPRTAPSAMHFIGKVKNVGGTDAQRVAVTISAVDATQGTPCLQEEAPVSPSTLRPGETGNFDVDLDSPCLYGDPTVDVVPIWE